ncbi:Z1 domain-containing protein, partial [Herbaspirillum chlorophenolicum]
MNIINGRPLTETLLEEVLAMLPKLDPEIGETELKRVRSKLESTIGIQVSVGGVVREDAHEPWLFDEKGKIDWQYWDSYKQLLVSQGWSPTVVRVLDEDTDNIITECGNPRLEEGWSIRGLVMGDVQSGKTASYSGVIAKAADAGYKVIVLLTGMIEDLRKQSQERLDFGFVGRDSRDVLGKNTNRQAIGAGAFRSKSANVLTSVDSDFLTANAQVLGGIPLKNINEPILFVIKKNISPLKNLNDWLTSQMKISGLSQHHVPLLVIDDEADNASVNVKKDNEDPAKINAGIRDLLKKFSHSSYVAYTATPFANIFINPDREDDLFPSNFIYSLNTPSNYIGASSIFLDDGKHHGQLHDIDDAEEIIPHAHKKDLVLDDIPESLKEAVRVFLISCAIRDIRQEELRHRSMLVNVSRFTDVQRRVSEKVGNFLWTLQEEIRQYLSSISWKKHPQLVLLQTVFLDEYSESGVTWEQ